MKFSVLLPTRNRLDLLRLAIETVRHQDYDDWEIIVSDNASDDDIPGLVDSLADERIHYVRSDRLIPVTDNWNLALAHCNGDYIIMLGDDDGLLPGYFTSLRRLIVAHDNPEVLYTCALLYAYPGVLASSPDGVLISYETRSIFKDNRQPFLLNKTEARKYVNASLDFRVEFDYNMQFFLVSRRAVDRLQAFGSFFQSPYPDYYASNVLLFLADSILIVPTPMVSIGISPKSFGYYYFNDKESIGTDFLNNKHFDPFLAHLEPLLLKGKDMNTFWLMAMEAVALRLGLKVNYSRYRELQIRFVFANALRNNRHRVSRIASLHKETTWYERFRFIWPWIWATIFTNDDKRKHMADDIIYDGRSHPTDEMPFLPGRFENILDVYNSFAVDRA